MTHSRQWFVRIERQPHRDAVRRLREAYRKLWEVDQSASTATPSSEKAEKTGDSVQEV